MDLAKAFTFFADDSEWYIKLGVGGLLMSVPGLNFAAVGYELQTARNVAKSDPRPMPQWDNLGQFFADGLWLSLAQLVYILPIMAVALGGFLIFFIGVASLQEVPMRNNPNLPPMAPLAIGVLGCALLFAIFYGFAISFLMPAMSLQFLEHGRFGACFDFAAMLRRIRQNPSNYLSVWGGSLLANIVASMVISAVGFPISLIPCLGPMIYWVLFMAGLFAALLVQSHLLGQHLRELAPELISPQSPTL
jgi:hypothetical protein